MSLISDALKKADLQRAAPSARHTAHWNHSHPDFGAGSNAAATSSRGLFFANLSVLIVLCVAAVYFLRFQPRRAVEDVQATTTTSDASEVVIAATSSPASSSSSESTEPVETIAASPFQPARTEAAAPPVTEDYDLVGTSTLGSNTLLSVIRRNDQRSVWIPVGKTVGEVTAVSYDPDTDQAVIRVRGNLVSVTMREFAPAPDAESAAAE